MLKNMFCMLCLCYTCSYVAKSILKKYPSYVMCVTFCMLCLCYTCMYIIFYAMCMFALLIYLHFIQKVQLIHRDYLMHYKYVLSYQYLEYPG